MRKYVWIVIGIVAVVFLVGRYFMRGEPAQAADKEWQLSEEEWEERLTDEEFHVLRELGTEKAFSGEHWDRHDHGTYVCAGCGAELFSSDTKFDSGTGWPSYYQPIRREAVGEREDNSMFMSRTEVHCKRCGGHLGHVFDDGPDPTGLRYCINSVSLDFVPRETTEPHKAAH